MSSSPAANPPRPMRAESGLSQPALAWLAIAVATALGGWLRLHDLGQPSLWVDEFFTIGRAGTEPIAWNLTLGYLPSRFTLWLAGADLSRIGFDNIAGWQALGVSERAARLGPAWVGVATIPVLGVLARVALGPAVAAGAALLLALLPFHVYWSQMARFYSSEFLFANAFLLCFLRAMQTGGAAWFAAAGASALLAFACHYSALFLIAGCWGPCALAWLLGAPLPHLRRGLVVLSAVLALSFAVVGLAELTAPVEKGLGQFSEQSWSPPVPVLVAGAVLRFEPVLCVVGAGMAWLGLRRRDPLLLLLACAAIGAPLGVLFLKLFFPVAPRYVLVCAFSWILLGALWAREVDLRLRERGGALLGATGLALLLVAVGSNAWLYTRDDAGARARWRDALAAVRERGAPDDPVYVGPGRFQGEFYLERPVRPLPPRRDWEALPPGSWIVHRGRGGRDLRVAAPLERVERYEIPSKPWSWVLHVVRRS